MTVNVIDIIMSTSILLFDQNFNANDVDIMAFEPCVLFPTQGTRLGGGGGIEHMVPKTYMRHQ